MVNILAKHFKVNHTKLIINEEVLVKIQHSRQPKLFKHAHLVKEIGCR